MRVSTALAAVSVATSAVLLLSACGSDSKGSDKIAGVQSAAPTTSAPTAAPAASGAPVFNLPPDVKITSIGFNSGDPTQKAVLRDTTYAITAILEAESKITGEETPNFKRYFTGLAGAKFADTIIKYGKTGRVITGSYRYYQPVVKIDSQGASVNYCEDSSQGYGKVAKTGQIEKTTPSVQDYAYWSFGMAKNAKGDWQVVSYNDQEGSQQCQSAAR